MQVGPSNHEEEEVVVPFATDTNISTDSEERHEEFMLKMVGYIEHELRTLTLTLLYQELGTSKRRRWQNNF